MKTLKTAFLIVLMLPQMTMAGQQNQPAEPFTSVGECIHACKQVIGQCDSALKQCAVAYNEGLNAIEQAEIQLKALESRNKQLNEESKTNWIIPAVVSFSAGFILSSIITRK